LTGSRSQKTRIFGAGIVVAIAATSIVQLMAGTGGALTTSKTQSHFITAAKVTSNNSATVVATPHNPVKTLRGYAPDGFTNKPFTGPDWHLTLTLDGSGLTVTDLHGELRNSGHQIYGYGAKMYRYRSNMMSGGQPITNARAVASFAYAPPVQRIRNNDNDDYWSLDYDDPMSGPFFTDPPVMQHDWVCFFFRVDSKVTRPAACFELSR
jgi:hypothetical protein